MSWTVQELEHMERSGTKPTECHPSKDDCWLDLRCPLGYDASCQNSEPRTRWDELDEDTNERLYRPNTKDL